MTYFIRNGNTYRPTDEANVDISSVLPAGNYIVKQDMFGNFLLEQVESFKPLPRYYGECESQSERIINTFREREASTGVMLNGEKGSGKTLLGKYISIKAAKMGIPTIIINKDWHGDEFNTLIQSIAQPCIIFFDEFEKVYESKEQGQVLTLLDGVFPTKKLFIITCNDKWKVDAHMRNRPGRIYYMLDFKGLSQDFVEDYCNDNLNDTQHIPTIINISGLFDEFNFDMLKALVEEMNRYNETPQEALRFINAKPEYNSAMNTYDVELHIDGLRVEEKRMYSTHWRGQPISAKMFNIEYMKENNDDDFVTVHFSPSDMKYMEGSTGLFVFEKEGAKLVLRKQKDGIADYVKRYLV